ncbi:MAG: hypothetical protein PVI90_20170, partial [Desulfobacteraceae bacterium]
APQITGTTIWHINSEEPTIFSYTTRNKQAAQKNFFEENGFRSSDHDPVIVGLNLQSRKDIANNVTVNDIPPPTLDSLLPKEIIWLSNPDDQPAVITLDNTIQQQLLSSFKDESFLIETESGSIFEEIKSTFDSLNTKVFQLYLRDQEVFNIK